MDREKSGDLCGGAVRGCDVTVATHLFTQSDELLRFLHTFVLHPRT